MRKTTKQLNSVRVKNTVQPKRTKTNIYDNAPLVLYSAPCTRRPGRGLEPFCAPCTRFSRTLSPLFRSSHPLSFIKFLARGTLRPSPHHPFLARGAFDFRCFIPFSARCTFSHCSVDSPFIQLIAHYSGRCTRHPISVIYPFRVRTKKRAKHI